MRQYVYLFDGRNSNEVYRILVNLGIYPRLYNYAADGWQKYVRTSTDISKELAHLTITTWTETVLV